MGHNLKQLRRVIEWGSSEQLPYVTDVLLNLIVVLQEKGVIAK